jgi:4-amino-4-deoxy-L-arabinose transferase-like glycosyltransferase
VDEPGDRRDRFAGPALIAITAGALLLRVAYVIAAKRDQPLLGDQIYYGFQAQTLADGRGFVHPVFGGPAADHPPVTALLMTPVALFTDSITAQRLAMAALGTVVVVAVAYLAHVVAGPRAGIFAAAIAALYPNLWVNDALVMSDTPTALAVAALLIAAYRWRERTTLGWAVAFGAITGVGALTRAELPLVALLVGVPLLVGARHLVPGVRVVQAGAAIAAAAVVVAPWIVPNLVRFDRPVLLSSNDGLTIVGANCDSTYYGGGLGFWDLRCAPAPVGDESEQAETYRTIGVDYARDHLSRLPAVVAARVGRVWGLYRPFDMVYLNRGEGREEWVSRLGIWTWWAMVPAAAAGTVVLRRRGVAVWPLLAPFVAVTVVAAAFYGIVRFRVPAEVPAVVLASALVARLSALRRPSPAPPAAAA